MATVPKFTHILDYKNIYETEPPLNRLDLIGGICKRNLVTEIAALNYRLRPRESLYHDTSMETQDAILREYCQLNREAYVTYTNRATKFTRSKNDFPLFFTRQTCVFALEEIIQSNLPVIENFNMARFEIWDSIIKYLLSVNTAITKIEQSDPDKTVSIEDINAGMLALNQSSVDVDLMPIPYRGFCLIRYILDNEFYREYFLDYFKNTYNVNIEYFLFECLGMFMSNNTGNKLHNFFYRVDESSEHLFKILSHRFDSMEIEKILSARKYPFYKAMNLTYLLIDTTFLIDKTYQQLIYDFWYDYIKLLTKEDGTPKYKPKDYFSMIGNFLESYVKEILEYIFRKSKHHKVLLFDQLLITVKNQQVEIADVYIRHTNNIFVGEVKATTLFDAAKYSGNIAGLYSNDRNRFFKDFGVNQTVNHIKDIEAHISKLDKGFQNDKSYHIYPVIIVNERAMQTPFIADIFQKRFLELLEGYNNSKFKILPLSVMHISDLERMQDYILSDPTHFWKLLKRNTANKAFIPPFYNTLNVLNIKPKYTKAIEYYKSLVGKYGHEQITISDND